jgi:hypothetical protein
MNTLNVVWNGSATIYANISDNSRNTWNGSGFEAYNSGHVSNYDIPLTALGGDLYSASVPVAVPVGTYIFYYYLQASGSPATTDELIDSYTATWNGQAITPASGSVILSPYALSSLYLCQLEIPQFAGLTGSLDVLKQFINEESATFERRTRRNILNRRYKETLRARYGKIVPRNMPVTRVERVGYGADTWGWLSYNGTAIRATIDIDTSYNVNLCLWGASGNKTTTVFALSTYLSSLTLFNAITALPGFTGNVQYNVPSDYILSISPVVLKDEASSYNAQLPFCAMELGDPYIRNDGAVGYDSFFTDLCQIIYWAGFEYTDFQIADIMGAVTTAVKIRYNLANRPMNFASEGEGKYNYSLKDQDLPTSYWDVVKTYRRFGVFGR